MAHDEYLGGVHPAFGEMGADERVVGHITGFIRDHVPSHLDMNDVERTIRRLLVERVLSESQVPLGPEFIELSKTSEGDRAFMVHTLPATKRAYEYIKQVNVLRAAGVVVDPRLAYRNRQRGDTK